MAALLLQISCQPYPQDSKPFQKLLNDTKVDLQRIVDLLMPQAQPPFRGRPCSSV